MTTHYDPFVVESIILGYHMPAATHADKAAAVRELSRLGVTRAMIAARLDTTERNVERLRQADIEPLPPLPDWADDYEREWPKCLEGHELTPDNYWIRKDNQGRPAWLQCIICYRKAEKIRNHKYEARYREARCAARREKESA